MREAILPDWLAELVRPKPAPLPWPDMIRSALAICVPLGTAFAVGKTSIGLLPALGGLIGTMTDRGGSSYLNRVKRISAVGVFGGAAGLAIGSAIHGRGWIAVVALMVVAAVSALLSSLGDISSQAGLQLLVYTAIVIGPFGALRPVWHTALGVAGTRPPPLVIDTMRRLADAIRTGAQPPMIPPAWDTSPGAVALRDAMAGAARVLSRGWTPGERTRAVVGEEVQSRSGDGASRDGASRDGFGQAALDVCDYMRDALGPPPSSAASAVARARKLRSVYRALGELRTEFQRTMSEPPSISRSATAWYPALVGLESVLDAVTSALLGVLASGERLAGAAA